MYADCRSVVVGNIDECMDYAERCPGFVLARFVHPSSIDNKRPEFIEDGIVCMPSPLFFHGKSNDMILGDMSAAGSGDLSIALGRLYESRPEWNNGFIDFSIRRWARNFDVYGEKTPIGVKVACYSEDAANEYARKSDNPPAPFEGEVASEEVDDDGAIDAVFVIGTGSIDGNEELRYALRNLENHCKFVRDVYICGVCPKWVDRSVVKHLNWPDRFSHAKDANIIDKLRHACEHRGIAKRILFCSDDQFQTRECTWDDFYPRYLRQYESKDRWYADKHRVWHSRLKKTLERDVQRRKATGMDTSHVFYYQPHIWMPIDRDRFIDYAKWCNYETRDDTIIASGYFNFIDADGRPDSDHSFLVDNNSELPADTHIAYHDGSEKAAIRILKLMFPNRSRFETSCEGDGHDGDIQQRSRSQAMSRVDEAKPEYDPSVATAEEKSEIAEVSREIRSSVSWPSLLAEVSRAEELRLFGVKGWRVVWRDIARRWNDATEGGKAYAEVLGRRSDAASKVLSDYMSNPESMKTRHPSHGKRPDAGNRVCFGRNAPSTAAEEVMDPLRGRIRKSLRDRIK